MTNPSGGPFWLSLRSTTDGVYEVVSDGTGTRYTVDRFEEGAAEEPLPVLRIDLPGYGEQPTLVYSPGRKELAKKTAKQAAKGIAWTAFILLNMFIARENARKGYFRGVRVADPQPGSPADSAQAAAKSVLRKGALGAAAATGMSALSPKTSAKYKALYKQVSGIVNQPVEGYYLPDGQQMVVRGPVRRSDLTDFLFTFGE
jgi:hypothetical protein